MEYFLNGRLKSRSEPKHSPRSHKEAGGAPKEETEDSKCGEVDEVKEDTGKDKERSRPNMKPNFKRAKETSERKEREAKEVKDEEQTTEPELLIDVLKFKQVIINLVSNGNPLIPFTSTFFTSSALLQLFLLLFFPHFDPVPLLTVDSDQVHGQRKDKHRCYPPTQT